MTTRFFIDSANRDDIAELQEWNCFTGITTNPTIIKEEGLPSFISWIEEYCVNGFELHVQLRGDHLLDYKTGKLYYKYGCNSAGLSRPMDGDDYQQANITGIMSRQQALLAIRAEPAYISVFAGRIRDMGYDVKDILTKIAADCHSHPHDFDGDLRCTQLIVGSIRHPSDIVEAIDAGADVVTAPPAIWRKMLHHPRTEQTLEEFFKVG